MSLVCANCGISAASRTLRSKHQGMRLCTDCDHCQYFMDTDHAPCPAPTATMVEPKPTGQFAPVILCEAHTMPWTRDLANLGDDWSILLLVRPSELTGELALGRP